MRIFTAGISTETNTFAPWPTGLRGFQEGGLYRGNASRAGEGTNNLVARLYRDLAQADGHQFVEGLFTIAQPSGPTLQNVWESLRDEIVAAVTSQGPFDVILLLLHGAMVATECDDCEADLVGRLRTICGPGTVIGVELDPHCHLSQTLIDLADAVILMKEYPHDDYVERARELYALCVGAAEGRVRPVSALFDCRMIGFYPTTREPMASLVRQLHAAEQRPGILSASFAHGFPWGDTADTGSRMLVIADGDAELATATAAELGRLFYDQREALRMHMPGVEEALDQAQASPGRIVLADTADNAGGGAPSDNMSLLRAMLARGVTDAVFGAVWDPMSAQACAEAGVGARFALRLGGKCGEASGEHLDVEVTVRAIREHHDQQGLGGARQPMGLSVWIDCQGIDVVVNSVRTQVFGPDAFTGLGIELTGKRIVALKSSQHFHTLFAPLADRVISVGTPGAIQMNFAEIAYRKRRDLNFYPRVHDPLA
ncbi:M81 family metallopeptidase [Dyella sp. 20L07]|uniref:M81 family metallopeptidase n=1 Tax=Dyella sp. 20L07 TaxID=3384240 RepID=UPI003D2CB448